MTNSAFPTPSRQYYFVNTTMRWSDAQYWCNLNYEGTLVWFEKESVQIAYDAWVQGASVGNGAYDQYWYVGGAAACNDLAREFAATLVDAQWAPR